MANTQGQCLSKRLRDDMQIHRYGTQGSPRVSPQRFDTASVKRCASRNMVRYTDMRSHSKASRVRGYWRLSRIGLETPIVRCTPYDFGTLSTCYTVSRRSPPTALLRQRAIWLSLPADYAMRKREMPRKEKHCMKMRNEPSAYSIRRYVEAHTNHRVTPSCGNVFADLGLADADYLLAMSDLARQHDADSLDSFITGYEAALNALHASREANEAHAPQSIARRA